MAYHVDKDFASTQEVDTKLAALLNGASITTLHAAEIVKVGADKFLCYIVYE
jgi:hypothetical protein